MESESKICCAELLERVLELQKQEQELTARANRKVMEVANKLREDKPVLNALMRDKEEMERIETQRRNFKQNTTEKLQEMELSLRATRAKVESANASLAALEAENSDLKREKDALASSAENMAMKLDEVLARRKKNKNVIELQEKTKSALVEELEAEKRKRVSLKERVDEAEDLRHRLEAMLNQEIKEKEELLLEAGELKKERERRQNERREQLSRTLNQPSTS